jgi:hypothetical protein
MNSKDRIYTTVARDRIVEEGDPEAAFLVASAGGEVPAEYLGIYREYRKMKDEPKAEAAAVAEPEAKPEEAEVEAKSVEKPPENKARAAAEKK